ncbi:MAG: glycosyltransferase [PVC group bacterium]
MMRNKRKITVLHVIDSLPREGAEMVVYDLIQRGDREKFRFLVCALTRGGGVADMLRAIGVPVFVLGRRSPFDLKSFRRLLGIIRDNRVRIIHTHLFSSHLWGWAGAVLCPRCLLFRTEHNMSEWKNAPRRLLDYILAFRTDQVIAVSEPVRRSLVSRCGIPARKVRVVANGLNLERLRKVADPAGKLAGLGVLPGHRVVATAAALTPKKGHRYLLEAAEKILGHRQDVYFLLLGEGELRGELGETIRARGLDGRVFLLGSRPDAAEIVGLSDVFVLSSIREGLSIALLEAMALKRAVVATAVGGSSGLVRDGFSGLLVPPRDGSALAQAIERVLDDRDFADRLGRTAQNEVAAGYDIGAMVGAYQRLYRAAEKTRRKKE